MLSLKAQKQFMQLFSWIDNLKNFTPWRHKYLYYKSNEVENQQSRRGKKNHPQVEIDIKSTLLKGADNQRLDAKQ